MARTVFFISDSTGITAETLGRSLLAQFETLEFEYITIPYINTIEKAQAILPQINSAYEKTGLPPLLFVTELDPAISNVFRNSKSLLIDFFNIFMHELENELNTKSSNVVGKMHSAKNSSKYDLRMAAMNYALACDDGTNTKEYKLADLILIGVSRSGKTPTSIYLALQFGIFAANYPLTEEDLQNSSLPKVLIPYQKKLFGLTVDPERLQQLRQERLPNSHYSSLERCKLEDKQIKHLYNINQIPYLDTTTKSIEETSTSILAKIGLPRRLY